jgi:putative ABC transport system permease protein
VLNDKPDNFSIFGTDTIQRLWDDVTFGLFSLLFALSSVALLVGGVGVMNIMLVSVTERTREIGVRKALGARQRDVLMQFLIESGLMATLGGVIGILIGVGVAALITQIFDVTVNVSLGSILLGMFMATGTGVFFGVYPASKAAKLDPIVALRSEM